MRRQFTKPPFHKTRLVCNQSDRLHGASIRAVAVHSTESADIPNSRDDLDSIFNWFDTPASLSSSHLGIDGEGQTDRWVLDARKAWTILDLNSVTLNIEFIGRAVQPGSAWEKKQIRAAARWVAYWSRLHGIPIRRGKVRNVNGQAVVTKSGVITHKQLTDAGFGTHTDPGPNFPMRLLLKEARWYRKHGWIAD